MQLDRRRFITISAAAIGLGAGGTALAAGSTAKPVRWQGTALGAKASLILFHSDKQKAEQIINACVAEIDRLESIFSLYRDNSAILRLNKSGALKQPPPELVEALADCRRISEITGGAFDVSVQPLWQLFARHFSKPKADPAGPSGKDIARVKNLVDYQAIHVERNLVSFSRPGMAITLNGFAQGFITDRIAQLLRGEGLDNVLVDMGETRALGGHPDGRPWRVGIRAPGSDNQTLRTLPLDNQAMATSGAYGLRFAGSDQLHHLFDPGTGTSSQRYASVTVMAPSAATADALSTALSSMPVDRATASLKKARATAAWFLLQDGSFRDVRA